MSIGRPTKYKEEYCQMLIDHMAKGFSFESFAGLISVNRDTIYHWETLFPAFSDAKKEAFSKSRLFWEQAGMNGMASGTRDFNAAVWVFNMKNRFNWRDKVDAENKNETQVRVVVDGNKD